MKINVKWIANIPFISPKGFFSHWFCGHKYQKKKQNREKKLVHFVGTRFDESPPKSEKNLSGGINAIRIPIIHFLLEWKFTRKKKNLVFLPAFLTKSQFHEIEIGFSFSLKPFFNHASFQLVISFVCTLSNQTKKKKGKMLRIILVLLLGALLQSNAQCK